MNISETEGYIVIEMPAYVSVGAQIDKECTEAIQQKGKEYVLDMGKATNLSSSGLRLITQLYNEVKAKECKFYIVNTNEAVRNALESSNIDKEIPVFDSMIDLEIGKSM